MNSHATSFSFVSFSFPLFRHNFFLVSAVDPNSVESGIIDMFESGSVIKPRTRIQIRIENGFEAGSKINLFTSSKLRSSNGLEI